MSETLPRGLRETEAVRAAVEALRGAVDRADAGCRKAAAAAARHAEAVVRFFCATLGWGVAGVQVTEDGFIAATADRHRPPGVGTRALSDRCEPANSSANFGCSERGSDLTGSGGSGNMKRDPVAT